ncbi:MAG: hypothetical protein M0Z31_08880 [Clostridia bacterium]|nr:hypothetical protein [Clostridia bacterium]
MKYYILAKLLVEDKGKEFSLIPTIVIPQYEFDWKEEEKLTAKDLKAGKVKRYSGEGYLKELESRLNQKITQENSGKCDS